jgi:hypothetical protein
MKYEKKHFFSCGISPHRILIQGIQIKAEYADKIDMHYNLYYADYI